MRYYDRPGNPRLQVSFSPDGAHILTGSEDKTTRLWNATTGTEIRRFEGHKNFVYSVAFSRDGAYILTGSTDKTARLWEAATGRELRRFEEHQGAVYSVAFSPDGASILTGSEDETAGLWDTATGTEIFRFEGQKGANYSVAYSPQGKHVLTGSSDRTARLWNIKQIPDVNIFDLACARLPDHDLMGLGNDYGLDLSHEPPICQKDEATGKFTTPFPGPLEAK